MAPRGKPFERGKPRYPGAGIQKGYKYPQTLDREASFHAFRTQVMDAVRPMTQAQIAHAQGVSYMILRAPDGSYARATDAAQIDAACAAGSTVFQIFTAAPNPQAYVALMDRTFGRPPERVEISGPGGTPIQVIKPW